MQRPQTDHILIHCSLDLPDSTIGSKEIDRRHRAEQKFGIGYHFVIRRDGTVDRGRALDDAGIHARGYNHRSVGICLIGGRALDGEPFPAFTQEQFVSLRSLLGELLEVYPEARIRGHSEVEDRNEDCPGFSVSKWIETGEVEAIQDRQEGNMTDGE